MMHAYFNPLPCLSFLCQALDLICAVKGGVVAANTSQNLGVLPCTFNVEKPLMCLTFGTEDDFPFCHAKNLYNFTPFPL